MTTVRTRRSKSAPRSSIAIRILNRGPRRLRHPRDGVGQPADPRLELLGGVGHDRRVEAEPGHHEEPRGAPSGLPSLGAPRVLDGVQPQSADVDPPVPAGDRHLAPTSPGRPPASTRLRASRFPVPPGSRPIGPPGPTIAWATARTVPSPPSAHTTSTPWSSGLARLADAHVLHRGLDQQRLVPAAARHARVICARTSSPVVELGGVDDDRRLPLGAGAGARRPRGGSGREAGRRRPNRRGVPVSATESVARHGPATSKPAGATSDDRTEGHPAGVVRHRPGRYRTQWRRTPARWQDRRDFGRVDGGCTAGDRHHGRTPDDVADRPAGTDRPSAIPHDTKDWTWVLRDRCPDCGFDRHRRHPGATVAGLLHAAFTDAWPTVLAAAGRRASARPRDVVAAGVRLPRARRLPPLRPSGCAGCSPRTTPSSPTGTRTRPRCGSRYAEQDPAARRRRAGRRGADAGRRRSTRCRPRPVEPPGHRSDGTAFTVETLAPYLVHEVEHHLHDVHA